MKNSEVQTQLMRAMFDAAVKTAMPANCIPAHMPKPPKGLTIVVGAGKASAAMAQVFEQNWNAPLEGLVVTRYGHGAVCKKIEIVEAAHPVPDDAGTKAAARMLQMVQGLTADDLVVALNSGGGSALLSLPAEGISVEDKRAVNIALLKSGAPINEMNCVRKHLSAIKGGRLAAAAYPAKVLTLVISDVPGDDLAAVASGPTIADSSTFAQARAIIARYEIEVPNGGSLVVRGNTIVKGPKAENHSAMIVIGAEGVTQPTEELTIENNKIRSDGNWDTYFVNNITATEAMLRGNTLSGAVKPLRGDGKVR